MRKDSVTYTPMYTGHWRNESDYMTMNTGGGGAAIVRDNGWPSCSLCVTWARYASGTGQRKKNVYF